MATPDDLLPRQRLRTMQIIAGSMLVAVMALLAVSLYLVLVQNNGQGLAAPADVPFISLMAVLVLAVDAPLALVFPGVQLSKALRQVAAGTWPLPPGADPLAFHTDIAKLLALRQTTMIVTLALLQGAGFLGGIAYLLEAQPVALAVAGVAFVFMLAGFPTEARVRAWLERQVELLAELRQQGNFAAER